MTESSVKTNFIQYQPSATWFTPTIVYDDDQLYRNSNQIKDKNSDKIKLSRQRFSAGKSRRNLSSNKFDNANSSNNSNFSHLKSADQKSLKNSIKIDNSKSESKTIENRQLFDQSPILHNNTNPANLLKTKEKGIKIITEFELIHKGMKLNK